MEKSPKDKRVFAPIKIWQTIFYLPKFFRIFKRLMRDKRVPWYAKAMPILAIVYVISPIDLIPGLLLPFIGGLDDLIALFLGYKGLVCFTPHNVLEEHLLKVDQEI